MNLMKCPNGHHYDASRFSSCLLWHGRCERWAGSDDGSFDVPVSQPGPSVATEPLSTAIPDDDDRTLPVTADMLDGATEKSAPVVGWLVCTEGVNKGTDYRLHQGRNFVGRSSEMDVCILGDNTVSRNSHAIVVYDPRSNVYLAQPGSSKELFYVNDKLVLNPIELKAMDQLSIGDTKLMFVPLCSEKFPLVKRNKGNRCDKSGWK